MWWGLAPPPRAQTRPRLGQQCARYWLCYLGRPQRGIISLRRVWLPLAVTWYSKLPLSTIAPAMTSLPRVLASATDSPVDKTINFRCSKENWDRSSYPIQAKAIPVAISGQDLFGVAQTGTGKTFAFGIPMIQRLAQVKGRALVLLPTRELANQVEEKFKKIR